MEQNTPDSQFIAKCIDRQNTKLIAKNKSSRLNYFVAFGLFFGIGYMFIVQADKERNSQVEAMVQIAERGVK